MRRIWNSRFESRSWGCLCTSTAKYDAIFSASERLRAAASAGDEGPPPWYYSDAVPGPGLDPVSETEERTRREIDALRAWYESWAAPAWRVKSEVESLKSEV